MKLKRIISALCWTFLIFGLVTSVVLPLTELIFRIKDGLVLGEDHYLRMITFGKWDGIVNPPIKYPYFQNSDVFVETFAFLGGIIVCCRSLEKKLPSFLLGIAGLVFWWFSISIAMYYDDSWSAQLDGQLAVAALAALNGVIGGLVFKKRQSDSMGQ